MNGHKKAWGFGFPFGIFPASPMVGNTLPLDTQADSCDTTL
jgi:hypothetical protein